MHSSAPAAMTQILIKLPFSHDAKEKRETNIVGTRRENKFIVWAFVHMVAVSLPSGGASGSGGKRSRRVVFASPASASSLLPLSTSSSLSPPRLIFMQHSVFYPPIKAAISFLTKQLWRLWKVFQQKRHLVVARLLRHDLRVIPKAFYFFLYLLLLATVQGLLLSAAGRRRWRVDCPCPQIRKPAAKALRLWGNASLGSNYFRLESN